MLLHLTQRCTLHPHSHAMVTDGVFLPDGSFLSLPAPDPHQLMLLFRHKLLQELLRLEKIYPATIEILDCFRHTGFSVHQSAPVLPCDTAAREKLAVYILHPSISLDRMAYDTSNGTVDYRPKSSQDHTSLPGAAQRQNPLETLAALTDHIPNAGQQLLRYLGWYSNKSRGLRKKAAVAPAGAADNHLAVPFTEPVRDSDDTVFRKSCRRTWAGAHPKSLSGVSLGLSQVPFPNED